MHPLDYSSQNRPILIQSGTGFTTLHICATWPPLEVFMKETWRLELSVSVYGELDAVDPQ